jgi:hypothetical protein
MTVMKGGVFRAGRFQWAAGDKTGTGEKGEWMESFFLPCAAQKM